LFVQAAFYTPTYQCIYLKGREEMGLKYDMNAWNEYKTVVSKKTVAYDGMGGKFKNFNVIRIKSNTEKSKQEVVIYIDNVTLRDGKGNVVKVFDFEDGDPAGVYVSMGKPLAKNGTVVEIDGKKCFLPHAVREHVRLQWRRGSVDPAREQERQDLGLHERGVHRQLRLLRVGRAVSESLFSAFWAPAWGLFY
jgi:hypothetical protein